MSTNFRTGRSATPLGLAGQISHNSGLPLESTRMIRNPFHNFGVRPCIAI